MLSSDPYICDAEIAERLRLKPGTIRGIIAVARSRVLVDCRPQ
jgi:predicted transcriptional regulator